MEAQRVADERGQMEGLHPLEQLVDPNERRSEGFLDEHGDPRTDRGRSGLDMEGGGVRDEHEIGPTLQALREGGNWCALLVRAKGPGIQPAASEADDVAHPEPAQVANVAPSDRAEATHQNPHR